MPDTACPYAPDESWETRREAALDLSTSLGERITPLSIQRWRMQDPDLCPVPTGKGQINKAALWNWATKLRRRPGRTARQDHEAGGAVDFFGEPVAQEENKEAEYKLLIMEQQIIKLQHQNAVLEKTMVSVESITITAKLETAALREWILSAMVSGIGDFFLAEDRLTATEKANALVIDRLNAFADAIAPPAAPAEVEA